jgi:hypothetical protein
MTEIIKEKLKTIKGFGTITKLEITNLITTIESLQEEKVKWAIKERYLTGAASRYATKNESLDKQLESLKAITELAVKSLQEIADYSGPVTGEDAQEMRSEARSSLSEIERLQNE